MSKPRILSFLAGLLLVAGSGGAQSPDPGVTPVRLLDRAEIRVSRVELAPGAIRSVHIHEDARFHVWVALSGKLEITIGSGKPTVAAEGQAFFMEKGTPHGFRNVGTGPAAVMEIFVKEGSADAAAGVNAALEALRAVPGKAELPGGDPRRY